MKLHLVTIAAAALACVAARHARAQDTDPGAATLAQRDCGAYCAGVVLDRLGLGRMAFDRLRQDCNMDEEGRCSLLDVARALERRGASPAVEDVGDAPPSTLAVVLAQQRTEGRLEGSPHLIVVEPVNEETVLVYYPPLWAYEMRWAALRKQISGPALTLRREGSPVRSLGAAAAGAGVVLAAWALLRGRFAARPRGGVHA